MLEDTASDVCAVALAAYNMDDVRNAAKIMSFGEHQRECRALLAIEIAKRHLAQRDSLRHHLKEVGHCCPSS